MRDDTAREIVEGLGVLAKKGAVSVLGLTIDGAQIVKAIREHP